MRSIKLLAIILFFASAARGTYVDSGKSDFAFATSTTCVPNGSGVTIGNSIVIAVQSNDIAALSITASSKVTTWVLDQFVISSVSFYMWHGVVTSAGVESVTVTKASGTDLIGSACGEWTSSFNSSGMGTGSASTTGILGHDVVAFASSGGGGIAVTSPFTLRQNIDVVGTHYALLADASAGSSGTYTATFTNANLTFIDGQVVSTATRHAKIIRYHLPNPHRSPLLFARAAWRREDTNLFQGENI